MNRQKGDRDREFREGVRRILRLMIAGTVVAEAGLAWIVIGDLYEGDTWPLVFLIVTPLVMVPWTYLYWRLVKRNTKPS